METRLKKVDQLMRSKEDLPRRAFGRWKMRMISWQTSCLTQVKQLSRLSIMVDKTRSSISIIGVEMRCRLLLLWEEILSRISSPKMAQKCTKMRYQLGCKIILRPNNY